MTSTFNLPSSMTRPKKGKKSQDLLWAFCCENTSSGKAANELYFMLIHYSYNYMRVDTSMQAARTTFGKDETSELWLKNVTEPRNASIERIIAKIAEIMCCDKHHARAVWLHKFPTNLDYLVVDQLENDKKPVIDWFINYNHAAYEGAISATAASLAEEERKQNMDLCMTPLTIEEAWAIDLSIIGMGISHANEIVANNFDQSLIEDLVCTPPGVPTDTWLRILYTQFQNLGAV